MKKKRQRKNEGGITLIALVVTIIILLILAGVTLGIVASNGGLIDKTKQAISEHENAQEKEQEELGKMSGMMSNLIDGLGSTREIGSSEVTEDLKEYQGKYVDIGLDITGTTATTDDWEIFYATNDRIFLIAADYVPTSKLEAWNIIGDNASENNGFTKYDDNYCVYWPSAPTSFKTLPTDPSNFLELVMHTQYDLNSNNGNANSKAVSYLLDTTAWNGIKEAATKKAKIDFVIGGPTLEMWCAAWNKAIEGDTTNGFVEITPAPVTSGYGYNVSSSKASNQSYLYMNGTASPVSSEQLNTLGTTYKTFFTHTASSCTGYLLASPSAGYGGCMMHVYFGGDVSVHDCVSRHDLGVRPVVSLKSGVQIVERKNAENIYDLEM